MKKILLLLVSVALVLVACTSSPKGPNLKHYKEIVKELSSEKYQGRGYARDGVTLAGQYLEQEFKNVGVDEVVCQPFNININTFCGNMEMWADGKQLTPGVDFAMREYSPGVHLSDPAPMLANPPHQIALASEIGTCE